MKDDTNTNPIFSDFIMNNECSKNDEKPNAEAAIDNTKTCLYSDETIEKYTTISPEQADVLKTNVLTTLQDQFKKQIEEDKIDDIRIDLNLNLNSMDVDATEMWLDWIKEKMNVLIQEEAFKPGSIFKPSWRKNHMVMERVIAGIQLALSELSLIETGESVAPHYVKSVDHDTFEPILQLVTCTQSTYPIKAISVRMQKLNMLVQHVIFLQRSLIDPAKHDIPFLSNGAVIGL